MLRVTPKAEPGRGPSWVGIGAQRSGTTWFTRLATTHPVVTLARGGRKELHYFDRFLVDSFDADVRAHYRSLFGWHGAGEFTPSYLRSPWVPHLLADVCDFPPLVVVLLRDPFERVESGIRWRMRFDVGGASRDRERAQLVTNSWESALVGSMYGSQLAHWREIVGRENMLVLQYEAVRDDPDSALAEFWRRLGLGPVPLVSVVTPSQTSSAASWSVPDVWRRYVVERLREDVDQVLEEWPIDPHRWDRWAQACGSNS